MLRNSFKFSDIYVFSFLNKINEHYTIDNYRVLTGTALVITSVCTHAACKNNFLHIS